MRAIFLACLIALAFCDELHFYHYKDGSIVVDNETAVKTSGPIFVEYLKTVNYTMIAGLYTKNKVSTPFGFGGIIYSSKVNKDAFEILANCTEGGWGVKPLRKLFGPIKVSGTWTKTAHFSGWCYDSEAKTNYSLNANGVYTKTPFYNFTEAAGRAQILVGQPSSNYQPVHVLNFAVIGYPYINTMKDCKAYLPFKNATESKPGYLVVAKDGAHCAILDKEGDKFIHTNPTKKLVEATPMSLINTFFPKGYNFKLY